MIKPAPIIRETFLINRDELFAAHSEQTNSLKFSMEYSTLIEEYIRALSGLQKYGFVLASAGSFSRRELSPYSDIDLIFITKSLERNEKIITELVQLFWDNDLEVSHTVRDFSDIEKFLETDLHAFTQLFETRFLLGSETVYSSWNIRLIETITDDVKARLLNDMFLDFENRYKKYGNSPKVLEPNVKLSAGGLRDLQTVEWMYIFKTNSLFDKQQEASQTETFIHKLFEDKVTSRDECNRLLESYRLVLAVRNLLHLTSKQKTDRFEFNGQIEIAEIFGYSKNQLPDFMRKYFKAANVLNRFAKSMVKKFQEEISQPLPESLSIILDDDFILKGNIISLKKKTELRLSDIFRACYYRGIHSARFDEELRSEIIERVESVESLKWGESESSVFFREILKLPRNVGQILSVMNELGVLSAFMQEFNELNGFLQHGVYHCYTADEHTLISIKNVETLKKENTQLGKIFNNINDKEILYLALLLHDIAKPINISGHEIIGAEMVSSIMYRLGYSEEEIDRVAFLVRNHLIMEQTAFRRNLNDPETLNNFTSLFNSIEELDLLYLLTYADLSAVNVAIWTNWKSDLLAELYRKSKAMLDDKISGEELLYSSTFIIPKEISEQSDVISESHVKEHMDSITDTAYTQQFSAEEIAKHIEEIRKGTSISVLFKNLNGFTNITVITNDFPALLSKICGVLAINDVNIHDAKIFTRKDGIVIDTFNVTDFRSHQHIEEYRYTKIETDLEDVISGLLQLHKEVATLKSRWRRLESKLFKRSGQVKIVFENHEKYTIIDIFSPDRLGFLYQVTGKMNELGLNIYFAKISTREDDIVDTFYLLDRKGKKISQNDHEFIKSELTNA
ncbi:MAG: HD domain-containing protein, partial [Ignavibacteria bacterium]|nr:HD domain-containing protein [Ignavibacteria bacterium]